MGQSQTEILIGTAVRIVYEYPDWNKEYVFATYDAFKQSGTRVDFDADVLYEFVLKAARLRKQDKKYAEVEKELAQEV